MIFTKSSPLNSPGVRQIYGYTSGLYMFVIVRPACTCPHADRLDLSAVTSAQAGRTIHGSTSSPWQLSPWACRRVDSPIKPALDCDRGSGNDKVFVIGINPHSYAKNQNLCWWKYRTFYCWRLEETKDRSRFSQRNGIPGRAGRISSQEGIWTWSSNSYLNIFPLDSDFLFKIINRFGFPG